MTQKDQQQLGKTLWNIADDLRGAMNADDFRDYMLSFLFLRYLMVRPHFLVVYHVVCRYGPGGRAGRYAAKIFPTIVLGIGT